MRVHTNLVPTRSGKDSAVEAVLILKRARVTVSRARPMPCIFSSSCASLWFTLGIRPTGELETEAFLLVMTSCSQKGSGELTWATDFGIGIDLARQLKLTRRVTGPYIGQCMDVNLVAVTDWKDS